MIRLVLFAKRPVLGRVKTRLVPPLTPAQALDLYRAFLSDQIRFLRCFAGDPAVELRLDGPWSTAMGLGTSPPNLAVTEQGAGDLGDRLLRAFRERADTDGGATVVIGADSPTLPLPRVRAAVVRLEAGTRAVGAPAEDGGFVLLGLRDPEPALFDGVQWGGPEVWHTLKRNAREIPLELEEIDGWYDIDDASGLDRLLRELQTATGRERAPATTLAATRLGLFRR